MDSKGNLTEAINDDEQGNQQSTMSETDQLRALIRAKTATQRAKIISKANAKLLKALTKIAGEVLRGKIPLSSAQFRKLKANKGSIRNLASLRGSVKFQRRKLLSKQRGGFLGLLAPLLAPLLGSVVASIGTALRGQR